MATTAWLIGSIKNMPEQSMTVVANAGSETVTVDTGSYYLYDDTSSLSLIAELQSELNGHAELSDVSIVLLESGKVRMTSSVAFSVTWSGTQLRNWLGFTGNLTSGTTHTATNVSPLLWSPGRTETPTARLGSDGFYVYDTKVSQAGPGRVVATRQNRYRVNSFSWRYLDLDRVWPTTESSSSFFAFHEEVLAKFYNWKLYRNIPENTSGSSALTMSNYSALPSANAYIMSPKGNLQMPFKREFEYLEYLAEVSIDATEAPEYT